MQIDLKQGDCLELLKDIPDKSIDLILIDPPYNISRPNNFKTLLGGGDMAWTLENGIKTLI